MADRDPAHVRRAAGRRPVPRSGQVKRHDDKLLGLLGVWPASIPLVLEAQHASWHVDETFAALRQSGVVLCTTDLDELEEPPDIRRSGGFLYLRLRRTTYDDAALDAWARRLVPFLDDGLDAYVLFRHDEDGTSAVHAAAFSDASSGSARPAEPPASLARPLALRGPERDDQAQRLDDVVEPVRHPGRDEDRVAGRRRASPTGREPARPARTTYASSSVCGCCRSTAPASST